MPRQPRKPKPVPPNGLVASAARITNQRVGIPKGGAVQDWQAEGWGLRDTVGELRFADAWISNTLSRVRLYARETRPGKDGEGTEQVEVTAGPAAEALHELFYGEEGQSQMLASMGSHFLTPGETWLVGLVAPDPTGEVDTWRVLSNEEVKSQGDSWVIDRGDGHEERYAKGKQAPDGVWTQEPQALVIRIWRPHPRKAVEADSPVRAALPILRELVGLTKHVAASIDSRLAGAGILLLPSEITFSTPTVDGVPQGDVDVDAFTALLTEAMVTPIGDRGNASAVVPLVVKAPGALLANVQHIKFSTELSEQAMELRGEAIRRLALSLDMPPEVLLGQADSNHWTAWQISEEAIKVHVTPLANLICHALTTRYLWPALQGVAVTLDPELRRFTIGADTSELRVRPQRSAEAMTLHGDLVLTDAALTRETGFGSEDLLEPGSEEYKRRLLQKVAGGVTTADLTSAALAELGVVLQPKAAEVAEVTPAAELPAAPPPPAPAVEAPRTPPEQQAATLLLGAEAVVMRALERAWNRAGKRSRGPRRPVPPEQLEACLHGAWDYLPRAAALCGVDQQRLQATLDTYTRSLLATGSEHDPMVLDQLLRDRVLTPLVSTGG